MVEHLISIKDVRVGTWLIRGFNCKASSSALLLLNSAFFHTHQIDLMASERLISCFWEIMSRRPNSFSVSYVTVESSTLIDFFVLSIVTTILCRGLYKPSGRQSLKRSTICSPIDKAFWTSTFLVATHPLQIFTKQVDAV